MARLIARWVSRRRLAEEDHILPTLDETELVQALDLIAPQRRLQREVEVAKLLDGPQRLECIAACRRRLLRRLTCADSNRLIASVAASRPPSMSLRIVSTASSEPGIFRSASMSRMTSR